MQSDAAHILAVVAFVALAVYLWCGLVIVTVEWLARVVRRWQSRRR